MRETQTNVRDIRPQDIQVARDTRPQKPATTWRPSPIGSETFC